jgi:phenylacetate-CoA ligase
MRKEIEERLGLKGYNIYGLSEIMGPGVSFECQEQNGSHISEDHFYPEIINPDTLEQLPYGTQGELVFTTLTKEGMPLLRYRTKDLCTLHNDPCPCGRTSVKMGRIMGRSDDMLIIRGVNVFPSQVEAVLCEMEEVEPHFFITVDRVNNTDTFDIQVEVKEQFYTDDIKGMVKLQKKVVAKLQSVIGISPNIILSEPRSIERSQGKAKRVLDKRKFQ